MFLGPRYILLWDHPLKTSANFHDFWPLPPSCWQFFTTIRRQISPILDPSPLEYADVFNGWSLKSFLSYFGFFEHPRNLFETCFQLIDSASLRVLGWSMNPPCSWGGVHLILKLSHFSSLMASSHFTNRRKKDKTKRYFSIMPKKYFSQELPTPFWYNFYSLRKWDKHS